jgi:hypothetical protein
MITIYNNVGKILMAAEASSEVSDLIAQNATMEGNSYLAGYYEPSLYYIANNAAVLMPEKPTATGEYDFDYNSKEWICNLNYEKVKVINIRNDLLQRSDWTDTVSAQTRLGESLYQEWQTYRQALRDIPLQEQCPLIVIWPTAPE